MDKKAELANANQALQKELTECKTEAQVLRSELELGTAILNTVSTLVVLFDPEGHIVRFNRACEHTTGYKEDEVRVKPFWDVFLIQDERESVKAIFEKIQVHKLTITLSHDWVTKDGSRRNIAWDYTPFLDSDGSVKYVIGTGFDITQRKQAESALHRLQEKLDTRVAEQTTQLEKENQTLQVERLRQETAKEVAILEEREQAVYESEEIELKQALAGQACLAVQLTSLAEQGRRSAVLEERNRVTQQRAAELAKINAALQAQMIERDRAERLARGQTEALVKTLTVLAAEPILDNFLGYVLQAITDQLEESSGGIWLYDETHKTTILHINYENGEIQRGEQITRPGSIRSIIKRWDREYIQLLREQRILLQDVRELPDVPEYASYRAHNQRLGIKMILVIPLFFGETFLGNITLRSTKQRDYQPEELELAQVLAYQATLAIQLTRLAEQGRQSAILEERNRMAREIHDTLAQGLTGIIVQLQAASDSDTTDPNERQAHIAQARLLAKASLAEARLSVRALRPQMLEDTDLSSALHRLLDQMATGTKVQSAYQINGSPYPLLPEVESNLLRIGQEALTNIFKHARASEVQIELVYDPAQFQLRVQDNGCGFDPHLWSTKGYGLLGMQERADSIGANLKITSQPKGGTLVVVTMPVAPQPPPSSLL